MTTCPTCDRRDVELYHVDPCAARQRERTLIAETATAHGVDPAKALDLFAHVRAHLADPVGIVQRVLEGWRPE